MLLINKLLLLFCVCFITESNKTLDGALAQGQLQKKWVFVYFISKDCKPCHKLEQITFTDKQVVKILSNFIVLRTDSDTENGKACLQFVKEKAPQLKSFPCYVIINPYNKVVKRYGNGFKSPEDFLKWLNK